MMTFKEVVAVAFSRRFVAVLHVGHGVHYSVELPPEAIMKFLTGTKNLCDETVFRDTNGAVTVDFTLSKSEPPAA